MVLNPKDIRWENHRPLQTPKVNLWMWGRHLSVLSTSLLSLLLIIILSSFNHYNLLTTQRHWVFTNIEHYCAFFPFLVLFCLNLEKSIGTRYFLHFIGFLFLSVGCEFNFDLFNFFPKSGKHSHTNSQSSVVAVEHLFRLLDIHSLIPNYDKFIKKKFQMR